jgi:hypothetical protein
MKSEQYTIHIPVTITADSPESLAAAKSYLRQNVVARIEAGANHENLVWSIKTDKPRLRRNED